MSRIEFCGGIGAGKSSLAAAVAEHYAVPLVSERYAAIPSWHLFYDDPRLYALDKDLSFLLSHADGIRAVAAPRLVCDFAMFQTVAYSRIAGDAADTEAVAAVFDRMTARLGWPALVVRLRCATDVQLRRIRARGRGPEASIAGSYLEALDAAIERQIAALPVGIRLIEIDTTRHSPAALLASAPVQAALAAWLA